MGKRVELTCDLQYMFSEKQLGSTQRINSFLILNENDCVSVLIKSFSSRFTFSVQEL